MNAPAAHWDILKQDLRYTARTLNRARGFALTAMVVTALGVGANTTAFSVADFVLLRSLPFPDPDTLVRLCEGPRRSRTGTTSRGNHYLIVSAEPNVQYGGRQDRGCGVDASAAGGHAGVHN